MNPMLFRLGCLLVVFVVLVLMAGRAHRVPEWPKQWLLPVSRFVIYLRIRPITTRLNLLGAKSKHGYAPGPHGPGCACTGHSARLCKPLLRRLLALGYVMTGTTKRVCKKLISNFLLARW